MRPGLIWVVLRSIGEQLVRNETRRDCSMGEERGQCDELPMTIGVVVAETFDAFLDLR